MASFSPNRRRFTAQLMLVCVLILASMPFMASAQDSMDEDSVFISIRVYDGVDPADQDEILRRTSEGFLPIISASEGFIGYYLLPADDVLVAMNLFTTAEKASASNDAARSFVVDNLAPLLPNPPHTIEGAVDISFVEMLDGMAVGDVSSLHASVRIYEDGFLPLMRESEGFFGYYLMNDGANTLSAISIFDSEASALASNEKARDFVAEYLTAFLPKNPLITSGRVGIAALSDIYMGANLIVDDTEEASFVSIRVYDGVDPADQDEIVRLVDIGFLTIMRESDGFVGYYLLPADDMLATISVFDSQELASASNYRARDYVAEYMAPLLPNSPMIIEGTVDASTQMLIKVIDPDDLVGPLYGGLRIYDSYDMSGLDEANELVRTILVPSLQEAGIFSYLSINDGVEHVVGLSVFGSEEGALAGNDVAAAFVSEYAADFLPDDPMRITGRMGIVATADILMGENLAEWTD